MKKISTKDAIAILVFKAEHFFASLAPSCFPTRAGVREYINICAVTELCKDFDHRPLLVRHIDAATRSAECLVTMVIIPGARIR